MPLADFSTCPFSISSRQPYEKIGRGPIESFSLAGGRGVSMNSALRSPLSGARDLLAEAPSMSDDGTTISDTDLARLLPTCQRCRRLRRKCDTQLPACRLCQKGKAECTFFDHALQQTLPRSYVHSLMTRLGRLKSVQTAVTGSQDALPPLTIPRSFQDPSPTLHLDPAIQDVGNEPPEISFDKHFILENANPTCWQFFGSSSAYSIAVEVLVHARSKYGQVTHQENYAGTEYWLNAQAQEEYDFTKPRQQPTRPDIEVLVKFYMATNNILTAYVDVESMPQDIDTFMNFHGSNVRALTGREAHSFFRLSMICATAAANKSRHQPHYAAESMHYYSEALQCVEEVTSDVSTDALVALLLLINFACFYPRKGDVWKLLDFACRLSVELNYHTEPNDAYEDEKSRLRRRSIFWGLYCVERTIGQHFGRPSDLPEQIITVEYPATLNAVSLADPSLFQYVLTSHYYRLTYIRSEIFRDLYMPARAPNLPRIWYEQRLDHILSWHRELQYLDNALGMGSMTCDIGFESSICFLFQPLLLRALVATKDLMLPPETQEIIPLESYYAACNIVDFYSKIFRGAENSPHGMYPVTIISAHYIYLGVMTIMANCLLALDGRLQVVSFMPNSTYGGSTPTSIDFHNIHDVSSSCVIVLSKLVDRFPGMIGLLDIYKNLSDKVLPAMMRSGLG